jgi:hypothetical protein
MKRIYVAQNPVDAQLIRDRLEAAGVRAAVRMDTVAAPSIPFPSVWVDDADADRAAVILKEP